MTVRFVFAQLNLTSPAKELIIDNCEYRIKISGKTGWIIEKSQGKTKKYRIEHVLGGKYIYYFLTPMEKGRLQVLPVAYDVQKREWYDTAASGIRTFPHITDEALDWQERQWTFNTMCYNCHVSQLSTNYDLKTDTYHTVWAEPGINCETCHGTAVEHNRVCQEAPEGQIPADLKIIRGGRDFTVDQQNSSCASCHAKMRPITIATVTDSTLDLIKM